MGYENLTWDVDGPIVTIEVDRPKALNALNAQTLVELTRAVEAFREDDALRGAILTGAGEKAFVAGADIKELNAAMGSANLARETARTGQRVLALIEACRKPVVACLNGYALGGGLELALACHFRYAQGSAKLGLPEVTLGLIPGYGGSQRLARAVGRGHATEMILTGAPIGAAEALRIGLVNKVFETKEAMLAGARESLATMTKKAGPAATRLALEAIDRGLLVDLANGLEIEADLFGVACSTADAAEGTAAFLEKRKPEFKGS